MNTYNKKYRRMILMAGVFGLLLHGGMVEAADYTHGMSGSKLNEAWLTDAKINKSMKDGRVTYEYNFNGKDSTFTINNYNDTDRETPLFAEAKNAVVINNQGGTLHMHVNNHAVGTGAINGISAITAAAGNQFTINSNLDLSVKAHYLAEAISVTGANTNVTINGDVKIRKDDENNPWGVVTNNTHGNFPDYKGARWAPALIWNNGNSGSTVTIHGNFNGASKGAGIVTDPYGKTGNDGYSTCYINLVDGDVTIETPQDKNEAYYALANYGGTININVEKGEQGYIAQQGHKVTLLGNIITMGQDNGSYYAKGQTNIGLTTKDSSWTGVIDNSSANQAGAVNLWLSNGATWNHESRSMTDGLQVGNMPSPSNGQYGKYDGVSHVAQLIGGSQGHEGIIYQRDKAALDVQKMSRCVIIDYAHNNSGENLSDYTAGNVTIHSASTGSVVTLSTDNKNINMDDAKQVENVLSALAKKLYYTAADSNLNGKVQIAEGLVTSGASRQVGDLRLNPSGPAQYQTGSVKKETGEDQPVTPDDPNVPVVPVEPGQSAHETVYSNYETGLMKGTREAVMASMLSWRDNAADTIHSSDILRDRVPGEKDGVWGKVYSGSVTYGNDSSNKDSYTTFQTGYDRSFDNGWLAGVGIDYHTGDASLSYGGEGKEKLYSLNLYGSKDLGKDAYFDVTGKFGYATQDFTAYNADGRKLDGSYHNRGYSLSTQLGKRYNKGQTYIEPQAQLTWAYLEDKGFENTSQGETMFVNQHAYNSLVGRLGIEAGRTNGDSAWYGKVSINHEFAGDIKADYSGENKSMRSTSFSTKDTWWDVKVGASHQMFKSGKVYAELGKTFGGDTKKDWEFDAGFRFLIGQGHTPKETYKNEVPTAVADHVVSTNEVSASPAAPTTTSFAAPTSSKAENVTVPAATTEKAEKTTTYMPIMPVETMSQESSTGFTAMEGDTYILGPVVVTASRIRQPILEAKSDISVVSRKEIEDLHIANVEEALRKVPGVQFVNYNTNQMNGNYSSIRINGSPDIIVLIDGVKVTDFQGSGQSGKIYASVLSNPDNIERVEVLRGSASAIYGSGAKGGIINIITRKVDKTQTVVDLSNGNAGKENYRIDTQGTKGNFSYNIYNDRTLSGSYKDGAGVLWEGHTNTKSWGGKFVWNFNKDHELLYSYDENESNYSGYDPIYIGPYNGVYSMKIHTVKDTWKISDLWSNTLTYRQSKEYSRYTKPWGEGDNFDVVYKDPYHAIRDYSYEFLSDQVNYQAKDHNVVFGVDYSKATGHAVNTGMTTGEMAGDHTVKNTSIYVQDDWTFLPKLTFTYGIRHDMPNLEQAPDHTARSYKLAWDMTDKDSIYVSRNDYYIMPSLDQLYGNSGSNATLHPSYGHTTSIGYNRKFSDRSFFTVNWYYTKAISDISLQEEMDADGNPIRDDNGNVVWHYVNTNSKTRGWNAQFESQFNSRLSGRLGFTHLNMELGENADDTFVTHGYGPKDLFTFGLTYDWNKWKTSLDGYYFVRMDSKNNHFDDIAQGRLDSFPHDRYAIFNLNMDYAPNKTLSFYLKVENLFDTLYAEHTNVSWTPSAGPGRWYSLPGRTFLFGMQMRF